MHRTPLVLVLVLVLVLLLLAVLSGRVGSDEPSSVWRDTARIEKRLAEAVAAVEKACGAKFKEKPTVVLSDAEDLVPILERELGPQLAGMGQEVGVSVRFAASILIAKYEPDARVIHLVPKTVERIAGLLGVPRLREEGVLRVILAHETTHALDFERFPLEEARSRLTTNEEMLAYGAVVEGHAQLVSERIAAAWGVTEDWEAYTRAITATPPGLEPAQRMVVEPMAAEIGFGYVKGHAFLRAVEAARGREGVEAALRSPPRTAREVERPALWLEPGKKALALDARAVFASLLEAVTRAKAPAKAPEEADEGDDEGDEAGEGAPERAPSRDAPKAGWTVQVTPAIASVLETQFAYLTEQDRAGATDALEEGQILAMAKGMRQASAFVGRFDSAEAARRFREVDVLVSRRKDELLKEGSTRIVSATYSEGVGKDHARPGTRVSKAIVVGGQSQDIRVVVGTVGRHTFEVSVLNLGDLEDATLDAVIEEACRAIEALEPPGGSPAR